jgi:Domain of unknown function (DUF6378)
MTKEADIPPLSPSSARKRKLLEDAILAVAGERQLNYGNPEDNFKRIAVLWNAWIQIRQSGSEPLYSFKPWEVAALCILLKLARLANEPRHRDSWLDIAGYAACGSDITEGMKHEEASNR